MSWSPAASIVALARPLAAGRRLRRRGRRRQGAAPAARTDRLPRAYRRRRRRRRAGHAHPGNAPARHAGRRHHHRDRLPGHRRPDPLGGLRADEGQGAAPGGSLRLDLHRRLPGAHADPAGRRGPGRRHDRRSDRRGRDRHRRPPFLQPQRRRTDPPGQAGPRRRHDGRQGRHRQHPPGRRPGAVLHAVRGGGAKRAAVLPVPAHPLQPLAAPSSRKPRTTAERDTST